MLHEDLLCLGLDELPFRLGTNPPYRGLAGRRDSEIFRRRASRSSRAHVRLTASRVIHLSSVLSQFTLPHMEVMCGRAVYSFTSGDAGRIGL